MPPQIGGREGRGGRSACVRASFGSLCRLAGGATPGETGGRAREQALHSAAAAAAAAAAASRFKPDARAHLHNAVAVLLAAARHQVAERLRGRQRHVAVREQRLAALRRAAVQQRPEQPLQPERRLPAQRQPPVRAKRLAVRRVDLARDGLQELEPRRILPERARSSKGAAARARRVSANGGGRWQVADGSRSGGGGGGGGGGGDE